MSQETLEQNANLAVERGPLDIEKARIQQVISRIANHEIKALLALVMLTDLSHPWTASDLEKGLRHRQTRGHGWVPDKKTVFQYGEISYQRAGFAVAAEGYGHNGIFARGFKVDQTMAETVQGVCGLMLGWSESHPELNLRRVLGIVSDQTGDETLSPQKRANLFLDILTSDKQAIAFSDLEFNYNTSGELKSPEGAFLDLEQSGILKVEHVYDPNNRMLNIQDGPFKPRSHSSLGGLRPETTAVYRTAEALHGRGDNQINVENFVKEVMKGSPELKPDEVRRVAMQAFTTNSDGVRHLPVLGGEGTFNEGYRTIVSIAPQYHEAIYDLVDIIESLTGQNSNAALEKGRQIAKEILYDKERFSALALKARQSSSHANRRSKDDWYQLISSLVPPEERVSVAELQRRLRDNGASLKHSSLYRLIDQLIEKGMATAEEGKRSPTSRSAIKYIVIKALNRPDLHS